MSQNPPGSGADDSASKPARSRKQKRSERRAARATELRNERSVPLDDIPDMPATFQGGFALPVVPSATLDAGARDWVSRFLPGPEPERAWPAMAEIAEPEENPELVGTTSSHGEPVSEDRSASSPAPRPAGAAMAAHPYSAASRPRKRRRSRGRGHGSAVLAIGAAAGLVCLLVVAARHYQWDGLRPLGFETGRTAVAVSGSDAPVAASESTAPTPTLLTPAPKAGGTKAASESKGAIVPPAAAKQLAPGADGAGARTWDDATRTAGTAPASLAGGTPASAAPTGSAETVEAPRPEAPARRYGLEVATFIVEDRALAERDRLAVTGYRVFLMTEGEGDTVSYRLVLGTFASREDAARAADALLGAGTVQQSRVVRLPAQD